MSSDGDAATKIDGRTRRRLPLTALVTAFVCVVCAALIGFEVWRIWNAYDVALRDAAVDTANLARSIGQHAQDTVKIADTALVGMVERLETEGTGPEQMARMNRLLAARVAEVPSLKGLFVYDETGAYIANSLRSTPPGVNNADREYMIYHRSHPDPGPHLGPPVISRTSGVWVLTVSRRFNHPDGSFAGVVLATLDASYFQSFYDTFDIGVHGAILLALRDGTLLVRRPLGPASIGQKLTGSVLFNDFLPKASSGVAEIKSSTDGVVRLNAYRTLEDYPLVVAAALSRDDILRSWRADAQAHLLGVAVVSTILALLGYLLTRQVNRIASAERDAAAAAARAEAAGAHYRLLADHSADLIIRISDGWIAQYVSPASEALLGYTPEELVGTPINRFVHPDDRPLVADHIRKVVAGAADPVRSYRLLRKDGREIWVEAAYWLVGESKPGELPDFVASLRDISTRKEAEARLLDAIESIHDGFVLWDAEQRFVLCNSQFRALFEFQAALVTPGVPMRHFQEEWNRRIVEDDMQAPERASADGQLSGASPEEIFAADGDGFTEWHLGDGKWILGSNRVTSLGGVVGIFTDITDRKQRELELSEIRDRLESQAADLADLADDLSVARDEAERANRMKSEFLAMMSHEIRTPMNGIIGMNGLLLQTSLAQNQRKYAEAVRLSAQSLLTILNDILDVSKLEAGKFDLEAVELSLEAIAEDAVELLAPRAQEKGLDIACYVAPAARRTLIGDPTRLRQILLNLLTNAVKFTDRGAVGIEVECQAVDGRLRLLLAVTDTGIGIRDADKPKLFRKFEQADGSITRRFGGTGLGLNISKQLVELMGGTISVADRPGGGTVFTVALSLKLAEPDAAPEEAEGLAGRRALLVDGHPLVRPALGRMLADAGMTVTTADDGSAGLAALDEAAHAGRPFDVVILDQAAQDFFAADPAGKRANGGSLPPRVLLGGAGLASGEATLSRFDAVVMKPVRHRALLQTLGHLFGVALVPDEPEPEAPADVAPVAVRGGHLLLAEDNLINREVAATILESFGYTLDFAADGAEAVVAARRGPYDVILMDVQMPNMDGLEATRQIRALGGAAGSVPIIAMTASAMEGDRKQCLDAGMDDYISTPIDAQLLLQTVARWIEASAAAEALGEEEPAAAPPAAEPVRDHARLDWLETALPADRFALMLQTFLDGTEQRLARLGAMGAAGDLDGLRHDAHNLISICGNIGEVRVQKLAERLQIACVEGDRAAAELLVPEIEEAGQDAIAFVRARLLAPAFAPKAKRGGSMPA